jgi:hypothetical protein
MPGSANLLGDPRPRRPLAACLSAHHAQRIDQTGNANLFSGGQIAPTVRAERRKNEPANVGALQAVGLPLCARARFAERQGYGTGISGARLRIHKPG